MGTCATVSVWRMQHLRRTAAIWAAFEPPRALALTQSDLLPTEIGDVPTPTLFIIGGRSPKISCISFFFSNIYKKMCSLYVYKMKWPKTEDKQNFKGRSGRF